MSVMNNQIDFLLRAVETLSDNHGRYFEFPRTASSKGDRGFNDGMAMYINGNRVIISGIGLNNLINRKFSIRFFGGETIKFKCDENGISFDTDFDKMIAERIFGIGTTANNVVLVAIRGLMLCFKEEIFHFRQFEVEAEHLLA